MAESENERFGGHGDGVDPGVDHCCRVDSADRSTKVVFELRDRTTVVSLISRSWLLDINLPVVPELPPVFGVEKKLRGLLVVFLVSTTPSSKEPSSSQSLGLGIDDRL